jgi:hypothetical protein
MKFYFNLNKENRLLGLSSSEKDGEYSLDIPLDHEAVSCPYIFKYVDGELTKDTAYQQHLISIEKSKEEAPSLEEQVSAVKKQVTDLAFSLMLKGEL